MYDDLVGEGWDDPRELREAYKPGDKNQRLIDGVIMVTSSLEPDMIDQVKRVKEHFLKESGSDPDNYTSAKTRRSTFFSSGKAGQDRKRAKSSNYKPPEAHGVRLD
jgi:hypothetical protein